MCGLSESNKTVRISEADNGFIVSHEMKVEGKHGPDYKEVRKIAKTPEEAVEIAAGVLGKGGKKKGRKVKSGRKSKENYAGEKVSTGKKTRFKR